MYRLVELDREHDLNKILRAQKRNKGKLTILFHSLWDKWSSSLVEKVKDKYSKNKEGQLLYLVDSYSMPHSFVIYKSSLVPHLVQLDRDRVFTEDYLPFVYKKLSI